MSRCRVFAPGARAFRPFYAAVFLVAGIQLPFWPVWLAGARPRPRERSRSCLAAAIWAKVVGDAGDRRAGRPARSAARAVMVALAAAAPAPPMRGCGRPAGFWRAARAQSGGAGGAIGADAARRYHHPGRGAPGRARLRPGPGVGLGQLSSWPRSAAAPRWRCRRGAAGDDNRVLLLVLGASARAGRRLRRRSRRASRRQGRADAPAANRAVAGDRRFWLFVVSAAALQASHQLYYGFGTLYLALARVFRHGDRLLWAEGVVAEIVLFWYSAPLVARLGPLGLMALGGRRRDLALEPDGGVAGARRCVGIAAAACADLRREPSRRHAFHGAARCRPGPRPARSRSMRRCRPGLGSGLVMLAAGALYAAYGGRAYPFMALLSAAGLCGVLWLEAGVALRRRRGPCCAVTKAAAIAAGCGFASRSTWPQSVIGECDCSICTKKGILHLPVHRDRLHGAERRR